MSPQEPPAEALRRLVQEARAENTPELDWEHVEVRLLREAKLQPAPSPRSPFPFVWAALAVAAAIALWFMGERAEVVAVKPPVPALREAPEPPLHSNGDSLLLGARVAAGERAVSVAHAGRATWTLSPNSSALLAGKGERVVVHLEYGSVLSEVVPAPKPETYVVEAAGTRIAVHGTVFRVGLENGRVIVQVREGTVAVGPLGDAPMFLLKAPAQGDFAADGRSGSIDGRQVGVPEAPRAKPLKLPPRPPLVSPSSSVAAPAASVELPAEPSINDIEVGIARVVDSVSECFSQHTTATEGVQITVRSALRLKIDATGAVSDVAFQPPLSPDVGQCAASRISQVTFAPSKQGGSVTRMLELKH